MANDRQKKSQWLAVVSGVPGLFDKVTMPDLKAASVRRHRPGGQRTPIIATDPADWQDMTFSRSWLQTRDMPVFKSFISKVQDGTEITATLEPTNAALQSYGATKLTVVGKLIGVSGGEVDSDSGEFADFALTIAVSEIK